MSGGRRYGGLRRRGFFAALTALLPMGAPKAASSTPALTVSRTFHDGGVISASYSVEGVAARFASTPALLATSDIHPLWRDLAQLPGVVVRSGIKPVGKPFPVPAQDDPHNWRAWWDERCEEILRTPWDRPTVSTQPDSCSAAGGDERPRAYGPPGRGPDR